ncbi:hypothetical protein CJ030_MR2G027119 [Morella rubra]|uniref:Uncharacterized protein n=1 Tax=Morella rubra TaxID=262757 RepID=A0A6A1WCY4_9ROSI|nr:hypothetical protein CJ030_MR2G027119 [Morella rubra]
MAKSLRSKREKRLRAIRREIVEPFYDTKDAAKLAAQEAALAAPKLPGKSFTEFHRCYGKPFLKNRVLDVEMRDGNQSMGSLKPIGGVGKKSKRKFKMAKGKRRGKGPRRNCHI